MSTLKATNLQHASAANPAIVLAADGSASINSLSQAGTDGYLRLAAGTGGIQFNGDTAAANALDDYEEGTFTPTIVGTTAAGVGTYAVQVGNYTKVGNLLSYSVYLSWSAHTGTGNMRVGGMPFTVGGTSGYCAPVFASNLTFPGQLVCVPSTASSQMLLRTFATGATFADLAMDTSAEVRVTGHYYV